MLDILVAGIVLSGDANGVWSTSHPHLYPPPMPSVIHSPKPWPDRVIDFMRGENSSSSYLPSIATS